MSIPKPFLAAFFAFPVSAAGICSFLFAAGVPCFLHSAWPYPNELDHSQYTDTIDFGAALEFAAVVEVHFDHLDLASCLVVVVLPASIAVVCASDLDLSLILAVVAIALTVADVAASPVVANNFSAHF